LTAILQKNEKSPLIATCQLQLANYSYITKL